MGSAPKKAAKKVTKKVAKKAVKKAAPATGGFFLADVLGGPQKFFGYGNGEMGFRELLAPRRDYNPAKCDPKDLSKKYDMRYQKSAAPKKKLGVTFPSALMKKSK